jgi:hypothetical protein
MRRLARLLSSPAIVVLAACGASPPPAPSAEAARRREVTPPLSVTSPLDPIVRIVGGVACTGTLIASDLVLTAHACVAARDPAGSPYLRDQAPSTLTVELGGDDIPWGEVGVRAIVAPACDETVGDGGPAVLVLSRRLTGISIATLHDGAAPKDGESFSLFGFGRCSSEPGPLRRRAREAGNTPISGVSPVGFSALAVTCPGDLGGPAFGSRFDLIGVLAAGDANGDAHTAAPVRFLRVAAWRRVLDAAAAIARGASAAEIPPYRDCPRPP